MAGQTTENGSASLSGLSNEKALLELSQRTGYSIFQENGQRKYGGPPPNWTGPVPKGCEVFVGKIPRDLYEDELVPLFEKIGKIYELRLMMDFSGTNRGFAFVMYTTEEDAKEAIKKYNNYEIRQGRPIGVVKSVDNCRLYVSGIPKTKNKEDILKEMSRVTEGVVDVIVYPSAADKRKNRGFAFVEYESHRSAAMARHNIPPQLWGHPINFDWAEPERDVDQDIMNKVKILYVRNLMMDTKEETLEKIFTEAAGVEGCIERVKKISDYCFIHYKSRDDAKKALEKINGTKIDGSEVEVVWAKPPDTQVNKLAKMIQPLTINYNQQPVQINPFNGYTMQPFVSTYTNDFYNSPNYYVPRSSIGVHTAARGRGRGAAGIKGTGSRSYLCPPRLQLPTTYKQSPAHKQYEGRTYQLLPDMVLTPINPVTLKPQELKTPTQRLEEIAMKQKWGIPQYTLHMTFSEEKPNIPLYVYRVTLPNLTSGFFTPDRASTNEDQAKNFAAQFVIDHLGGLSEVQAEMIPGFTSYPPAAMPFYN